MNNDFTYLRVLVVDDDTFMLDLIVGELNSLGVTDVITAEDGHQALQYLDDQRFPFNVLLCDLQMPVMDGIEFIRHAAERNYQGGVILLSGEDHRILSTVKDLACAHTLSVLGALEKPISTLELSQMLKRVSVGSEDRRGGYSEEITEDDLRRGLEEDQMLIYFQPKVCVDNGSTVGFESLVRWQHPERGIISPNTFVPLAEKCGLIDAMTECVFTKAMQQGATWKKEGNELKIGVNLSMDNLGRFDFPEQLVEIAQNFGVSVSNIMLEITESRLMGDHVKCLEILTRLRLKGFGLSIDDFGTGYSSLEQLKQIPFVELKVDRAFVHGATSDSSARAILESSIDLAKRLSMNIVVEGVETKEEWDLVERLGCDQVQGYYVAKPMPAEHIQDWLKAS